VVTGRQHDAVGVRNESGRQDPDCRPGTVGRLDLLAEWFGEVGTHEADQVAVLAYRYVPTFTFTTTTVVVINVLFFYKKRVFNVFFYFSNVFYFKRNLT